MALNRRLLILSCSQRKRRDFGLLPALQRYDGPAFRVLRKFLRECPREAQSLDVHILSAQFGLIAAGHPIPYYDRRMTRRRADELQPRVLAELERILQDRQYEEVFLSVGKDYSHALAGFGSMAPTGLAVTVSEGTQGRRLAALRDWLRGGAPTQPSMLVHANRSGHARIRGVEIALTPEQVLETARESLAMGRGAPTNYQAWYVQVDNYRVAPKWLVSQLTGLPVSAFVTDEALRVLAQLGVEVVRT